MRRLLFTLVAALALISCDKDDDVITYTVTFDSTGGTPTPASQTVKQGEYTTAPANPEKQGYVFVFWNLNGATTAYNFHTPVNSDITLYASWQEEATAEYWQVSWELDEGVWPSDDNHATQVVKGGTLAEPNAPAKTGKLFDGWYGEAALTNKINFPFNVMDVTADFTLYAKWVDPETEYWQITWELNGGEWPSAGDNHVTQIEKGGELEEPTAPEKAENIFDGWYKEAAFTNKVSFPYDVSPVTADFTLYAKWVTGDPSSRSQGLYIGNSMTAINLSSVNGNNILEKTLRYLYNDDSANNTDYMLIIDEDIKKTATTINAFVKENTSLTITSKERQIISTSADQAFISVAGSARLIITEKITFEGRLTDDNSQPIISVSGGGTFELGNDAVLRKNSGGAVSIMSGGTFIMKGGSIYDNISTTLGGGGVSVAHEGSTFIMEGGTIHGNTTKGTRPEGGGVRINGGTFIMKGGGIYNNNAYYGGGVCMSTNGGSFILAGGTILGSNGGGIEGIAPYLPGNTAHTGGSFYRFAGTAEFGNGRPFIITLSDMTLNGTTE